MDPSQQSPPNSEAGPETGPMSLGFLLSDVTRLLRTTFDAKMQEIGLTSSSWRVLVFLSREDNMSQAELARKLEVGRASLGQMIDRLEESGYVERAAHPDDRRVWRVRLTGKSHSIIQEMIKKAQIVHRETLGKLSADDYKALNRLLLELRSILVER